MGKRLFARVVGLLLTLTAVPSVAGVFVAPPAGAQEPVTRVCPPVTLADLFPDMYRHPGDPGPPPEAPGDTDPGAGSTTTTMAPAAPTSTTPGSTSSTTTPTPPASAPDSPAEEPCTPYVYPLQFPTVGSGAIGSFFGDIREGGRRRHKGVDIFAEKLTPIVAVSDGTIAWIRDDGTRRCCTLGVRHDDGWISYYIHVNNDTAFTDDAQGHGIRPDLVPGARVRAGEVIAWVGDSSNAEETPPHLHFEIRTPQNEAIDPVPSLRAAQRANNPDHTANRYEPFAGPFTDDDGSPAERSFAIMVSLKMSPFCDDTYLTACPGLPASGSNATDWIAGAGGIDPADLSIEYGADAPSTLQPGLDTSELRGCHTIRLCDDQPITRGEAAALLLSATSASATTPRAANAVLFQTDGSQRCEGQSFDPGQFISRGELAQMVMQVFGYTQAPACQDRIPIESGALDGPDRLSTLSQTTVGSDEAPRFIGSIDGIDGPYEADRDLTFQVTADTTVAVDLREWYLDAPGGRGDGTAFAGSGDAVPMRDLAPGDHVLYVTIWNDSGSSTVAAEFAVAGDGGQDPVRFEPDVTGPVAGTVNINPSVTNRTQLFAAVRPTARVTTAFADAGSPIVYAEAFIVGTTNDPAAQSLFTAPTAADYGTGFPLSAEDGRFGDRAEAISADIPLSTIRALTPGVHEIWVHARDAAGNWSRRFAVGTITIDLTPPDLVVDWIEPDVGSVTLAATATDVAGVSSMEWFVGRDPGQGAGTPMSIDPQGSASTGEATIPLLCHWSPGQTYTAYVRAEDALGQWSPPTPIAITVGTSSRGSAILTDSFDSGLAAEWFEVAGAGIDLSAGALSVVPGLTGAITDICPSGETSYRASFVLQIDEADPANPARQITHIPLLEAGNTHGIAPREVFHLDYMTTESGRDILNVVDPDGSTTSLPLDKGLNRVAVELANEILTLSVNGFTARIGGVSLVVDDVTLGLTQPSVDAVTFDDFSSNR